ncbi:MAG: MoaD/ThiS family protein [Actinomycetota bacterium]
MPEVVVRAPLKDLCGGNSSLDLAGTTVGEVIHRLEDAWPRTVGWVLDEQGRVRQHVNVFLNGERVREDAAVTPGDRLHILPAITGGR